ncbi:MAG: T9SS type A sorting domain-containing protein [Bacteroidetes bacterium]|nr:T9SS type A sorting domain-containing protein [Bacteroidota bacterium]
MKKIIFTLLSVGLFFANADAQYCGNSGASVCDSVVLTLPGFSPSRDSLPPLVNGLDSPTILYFKNYDKVANGAITVSSLRIDTIDNLPSGVCWSSNLSNNTFANQQNGCIKLSGIACAPPGQYKLRIIITLNGALTVDAESQGLKYFLRVKNDGDADIAVDTLQGAFFAYGGGPTGCNTAINEPTSSITTLRVTPNPMNTKTQVNFFSVKSGVMTERMTNMLGSEVYRKQIDVKTGNNVSQINRNDLSPGIYFYSIGDGKTNITKRIVISE